MEEDHSSARLSEIRNEIFSVNDPPVPFDKILPGFLINFGHTLVADPAHSVTLAKFRVKLNERKAALHAEFKPYTWYRDR